MSGRFRVAGFVAGTRCVAGFPVATFWRIRQAGGALRPEFTWGAWSRSVVCQPTPVCPVGFSSSAKGIDVDGRGAGEHELVGHRFDGGAGSKDGYEALACGEVEVGGIEVQGRGGGNPVEDNQNGLGAGLAEVRKLVVGGLQDGHGAGSEGGRGGS